MQDNKSVECPGFADTPWLIAFPGIVSIGNSNSRSVD